MSRRLSLLTWGLVLAAAATGLGQAWMRYLVDPVDDFSAWNHPWQGTTEALHAFLGPLTALGLGLVLAAHAKERVHLPSTTRAAKLGGVVVSGLILALIISGSWLTAWPPLDGKLLSWIHGIVGGLFVLGMAGHAWSSKRRG